MGLILIWAGVAAFVVLVGIQWERFQVEKRVREGTEPPGPVGRFVPIAVGPDHVGLLDTTSGQLWHKPSDDLTSAWTTLGLPLRGSVVPPSSKAPTWDEFGPVRSAASSRV